MDVCFWIFCKVRGDISAQAYALSREGMTPSERQMKDKRFLRNRRAKDLRSKFWFKPRDNMIEGDEVEDNPRDEVELLEKCLERTELKLSGYPDSLLRQRTHAEHVNLFVLRARNASNRRF
ncbi:hypothetical protein GN244_ATG13243 [Phytophthora infestans]|uniref:Uncharacterized protein n=1 Tax=Phytophthora infestans TaxID=4787 RepID=A0A833VYZ0_PHYIN|nr:hypothetical protein GN244_ATG13243 [Phytophthora infestans]KAF4128371.1 hypothetical protein GN958_ATG22449 [Phytophthora infestans]